MLKAYVLGLSSAALGVVLVSLLWFGVQPKQETGLLWGDQIYESRAEFDGYLRSKGLSYTTWVARNPGVAPWEPESFTLGAITVEASPKKVQLLLAVLAWVLATYGALLLLRNRDPRTARASKAAAVLFSSILTIVLVAGFWYGTQPRQTPGLHWGGTVYTSKGQFKLYLKSKGLSYDNWLAKNPGAAPWEPTPAPSTKVLAATSAPSATEMGRAASVGADSTPSEGWRPLLVPALALTLAMACAALLLRARRSVAAGLAAQWISLRAPRAHRSERRVGEATARAASRMKASIPVCGSRVGRASRDVASLVHRFAHSVEINAGDVAMALLMVVGAVAWGMTVVFALSAL